ncbi:MAG: YdcF family protein [Polyangiaceae bacterium]
MGGNDAFDDADDLDVPAGECTDQELCGVLRSLLRAELTGTRAGAIEDALRAAESARRSQLLLCLVDALRDGDLVSWIQSDGQRRAKAIAIAAAVAPSDPAASHNASVFARIRAFHDWSAFTYPVLIVPGYTPLDAKQAKPGVHPVTQARLAMAAQDLAANKAPFVIVSGANVYPRGTPYYEALEMKAALSALGVDAARILVDARARHTTTNLRNAGRMMRSLGLPKALVVTIGGGIAGGNFFGQDFYLAHPTLSTFHSRCEQELGYRVGELHGVDDGRIEFLPSASVDQPSFRDPLDP